MSISVIHHDSLDFGILDVPLLDDLHDSFARAWPKDRNPYESCERAGASAHPLAELQFNNYVHEQDAPEPVDDIELLQDQLQIRVRTWNPLDTSPLLPRCQDTELPALPRKAASMPAGCPLDAMLSALDLHPQERDGLEAAIAVEVPSCVAYFRSRPLGQGVGFVPDEFGKCLQVLANLATSRVILLGQEESVAWFPIRGPSTDILYFHLDVASLHHVDVACPLEEQPQFAVALDRPPHVSELRQTQERLGESRKSASAHLSARGHSVITATSKGKADREPRARYTDVEDALLLELVKANSFEDPAKKKTDHVG